MPKVLRTTIIFIVASVLLLLFPSSTCCAQVVINEISPSEEWVELFNVGLTEFSLDGCTLLMGSPSQDVIFSVSDSISLANKFKIIEKGNYGWTANWLNNDGDNVSLTCSTINESASYGSDIENATYGRYPDGIGNFVVLVSATKGLPNSSPTPTPTPTSPPTSTLTLTSTPTLTPTPTPTATKTPSPTKTPTPTARKTSTPTVEETQGEDVVLGLRNELQMGSPTPTPIASSEKKKFPIGAVILIVMGIGLVGGSGFVLFKKMREDNIIQGGSNDNDEQIH